MTGETEAIIDKALAGTLYSVNDWLRREAEAIDARGRTLARCERRVGKILRRAQYRAARILDPFELHGFGGRPCDSVLP